MTAATGVSRQAQDYLAAVEHELADLSAEDRSALMEDLALHLEALTAEDDDRPLAVRLGPAAAYAADLRAAAGLPPRGGAAPAGDWRARVDAVLASPSFRRLGPAGREVRRLLRELRPAWWVLRGYLVVLVPCLLGSDRLEDVPRAGAAAQSPARRPVGARGGRPDRCCWAGGGFRWCSG